MSRKLRVSIDITFWIFHVSTSRHVSHAQYIIALQLRYQSLQPVIKTRLGQVIPGLYQDATRLRAPSLVLKCPERLAASRSSLGFFFNFFITISRIYTFKTSAFRFYFLWSSIPCLFLSAIPETTPRISVVCGELSESKFHVQYRPVINRGPALDARRILGAEKRVHFQGSRSVVCVGAICLIFVWYTRPIWSCRSWLSRPSIIQCSFKTS